MIETVERPTIDPEFKAAMFPISEEEFSQLEENILTHGCLDPVKTWRGLLVDGHNRIQICDHYGISCDVVELDLPDRATALEWIDKNQLGRRNLTPDQMRLLRGRRYNREKKAKGGDYGNQHTPKDQIDPLPTTAERHAREAGVSPATIKRDAAAVAKIEDKPELVSAVQAGTLPLAAAVVAADLPEEQRVEAIASPEPVKAVKAHVVNNSGNNEWYTPAKYIEAARTAMGSIDCDPASCAFANETVKAAVYYDIEANGLKQKWAGNVWLNPPYSQPEILHFARAVACRDERGDFHQCIVLVNNATETEWFQTMLDRADAICFPKGRIRYLNKQGQEANTPLQGQVFLYFGDEIEDFISGFSFFGITRRLS